MIAHLKGRYIEDAGKLSTARKSPNSLWPNRKYYCFPSRDSSTISIDEIMMFFLDYQHKGVNHRRIAQSIDRAVDADNYGSITESHTYALRYANYKYAAVGDIATEVINDPINMMAQGFNSDTTVTTYPGYNDINKLPDNISNIIGFNKYQNDESGIFWASVRGLDQNATTLQRYVYSYPTRSGSDPLTRKFSVGSKAGSSDHSPMIFPKLGVSTFAHYKLLGSANNKAETFFLSPRQGRYINAEAEFTNLTAGWTAPSGL